MALTPPPANLDPRLIQPASKNVAKGKAVRKVHRRTARAPASGIRAKLYHPRCKDAPKKTYKSRPGGKLEYNQLSNDSCGAS